MNACKKNTRNFVIDLLKGIAIFLVLWGHIIQYTSLNQIDFFEDTVFRFIYGFHMPLFMGISGYLFYYSMHKYSLGKLIKRQCVCILAPMLLWCLICGVVHSCLMEEFTINGMIGCLKNSLEGEYWYLWSLLVNSLLMALLFHICCKFESLCNITKNVYMILCGFITAIILLLVPFLPCRAMSLWLLPYFVAGILSHNFQISKLSENFKTILFEFCAVLYVILLHWFHKPEYIYISGINPFDSDYGIINQIGIDLFRWILGFVGIGFIVGVARRIYNVRAKIGFVIRGGYLFG